MTLVLTQSGTSCEDDSGDFLYAEDSFYVQFKSESDKKVEYHKDAVPWLRSLQLPLFIGRVNKRESLVSLYACHGLSPVLLESEDRETHLYFDRVPKRKSGPGKRYVDLRHPLMRWSTVDVARPGFVPWAYRIMKPYLIAEQRNLKYRSIGYCEQIEWDTNEPLRCGQSFLVRGTSVTDDFFLESLRSMAPNLLAIAFHCFAKKDQETMEAMLHMLCVMRNNKFDPDPNNFIGSIYANMKALPNLNPRVIPL